MPRLNRQNSTEDPFVVDKDDNEQVQIRENSDQKYDPNNKGYSMNNVEHVKSSPVRDTFIGLLKFLPIVFIMVGFILLLTRNVGR